MDILQKILESPIQGFFLLIGSVFISIIGAYLKDLILKFLGRFSRKIQIERKRKDQIIARQAMRLSEDTNLQILFGIKTIKSNITSLGGMLLYILTNSYLLFALNRLEINDSKKLDLDNLTVNSLNAPVISGFILFIISLIILYNLNRKALRMNRLVYLALKIHQHRNKNRHNLL